MFDNTSGTITGSTGTVLFYFPGMVAASVQVTISGIAGSLVHRIEASLDGTNFTSISGVDVTVTTNGTNIYYFSGYPTTYLKFTKVSGTGTVSINITGRRE